MFIILLLLGTANAIKYCSGHDGCKNLILTDNDLRCSGGERCCRNVNMYCTTNSVCSVYIGGGGHDQFQDSEVFAQEAASFELSCLASGLRECQNTKIFCPMGQNAVCKCTNCPSSAKMYCPPGASCTAGGATLVNMNEYICKGSGSQVYCEDPTYSIDFCSNTVDSNCISVISQQTYVAARCKNTAGQYKRPKCPQYYQGKADNIVYHNVTRYHDINRTRYVNRTTFRYINRTRYVNRTRYINLTRYVNRTTLRYINRTRYINLTRYVNRTRYIPRLVTHYINKTVVNYVDRIVPRTVVRYINRTVNRYVNVTVYTNRSVHTGYDTYDAVVTESYPETNWNEIILMILLCILFFFIGAFVAYTLYDFIDKVRDCLFCF